MGESNQPESSEIIVPLMESTKSDKKHKKGLNPKKKLMIEAIRSQLGNISLACKQIGIRRNTHYDWLKEDPLYKEAYEEIDEYTLDFVENALMKQIDNGNITAIIFFLKCRAKKRGFIEIQEIKADLTSGGKGIDETMIFNYLDKLREKKNDNQKGRDKS